VSNSTPEVYGDWAATGIYAEDSANVRLANLDIHGLAHTGIHAGRLADWTVEDVRIAGNGWVGWDGDIEDDDSNAGTLTFRRWTVEWNGCGETYPGGEPTGCWAQSAGGYGDGVGTGATGGHWIIEDSAFLHNTSDGLDLLYAREAGSSILIRRTIAEGNAGDQLKTTGPTVVENVIAASNCGFFEGQSFTLDVDNCRAGGSALALTLRAGNHVTVANSTISGQGDCLIIAECMDGESCNGSESVLLRNDIFQGHPEFGSSGDTTCFTWYGTGNDPFTADYSIINGTKTVPSPCPPGSLCNVSPGLVNSSMDNFDAHLLQSSPAIDAGSEAACPATDYSGNIRPVDGDGDGDATCDMGAYEYGAISSTLQAAFSGAPLSGRPPLTVTFTNQSSGTYTATVWHFGDGETSTSENPTHTYTATGAFTVTLTISGAAGIDTETKPGYVKVWEATSHVHLPLILKGWITSEPPPQVTGCDVFPADNIWNTPIDTLPVDVNSATYVATIGTSAPVHADFGSGEWPPDSGSPIGIPYVDVPSTQPGVTVTFEYDDESDPGPYPIPSDAPIEGSPDSDGDRHVLVVDRDDCVLYELFYAWPQPDGSWTAGSGAVFDLDSHALRPDGWTSADAAGLPILPGLVRYEEVASGKIRHALRFTAPQTRRAYVWPARHYASSLTGTQYPPMGQRFRLRSNFDISGFSPEVQAILQALKTYGMMLADNGSAWYISGAPDERWDNDALHELHQVHGSDFEAVDVSSLMVDPNLGQAQTSR
jgi:PKD repeat protein